MVREIVRETFDDLNLRLPPDLRVQASPTSILLGEGSTLDSAAFLDLLLALEQRCEEKTGRPISLVNDIVFDPATSPVRTVGSLEVHLATLLEVAR